MGAAERVCDGQRRAALARANRRADSFEDQSQQRVLESLLRPAAGFILAPRREARAGATDFESVIILATSNPTQSSYAGMSSQPAISTVDPPEVPPIPPPPPAVSQPEVQPPAAGRPTTSPGVYAPPIFAVPPASSTGRGTTTPPPTTTTTTGRGRGNF